MESRIPDVRCARALQELGWFLLSIVALSAGLAAVIHPLVDFPWWKIFRRCVSVSAFLALWAFMRGLHHQPLRALGLGPWRQGRRQMGQGLLLGVSALGLMGLLYLAAGWCRISIHPDSLRVWRTVLVSLPAMGLVAVLEELIFRGYVLQQLLTGSKGLALIGSSAAYAVVHLRPNPVWPGSGFELIGLFLLGGVLALGALRTRQLYLAIGLHAALAYGARVNKLLVEWTAPSLEWLVGTNRLVNGVMAWLALLGIGWIIHRRVRLPAN